MDLEALQYAARMASQSEAPTREMFQFDRNIQWQQGLSRRATLQQVSAGAGCLAVGVDADDSAHLVRILPNIPVQVEECEFKVSDIGHVKGTWVDPSGHHILISGDVRGRHHATFYLNVDASKPSAVGRLKNSAVCAATWCIRNPPDHRDHEMMALLGAEDGNIYRLDFDESRLKRATLIGSLRGSIEALNIQWYEQSRREWKLRMVVLVKDAGGVKLFVKMALDGPEGFFEGDLAEAMPEAPARSTALSVYTPQRSSHELSPKPVVAFLTDLGISIATIVEERRTDRPTIDAHVIPIPAPSAAPADSAAADSEEPRGPPISLLVTRFHVLLLFSHYFVALNRLDYQISFQKQLSKSQFGTMKTLFRDRATGAIWALSSRNIFRVNVAEEDRNMWRLYLDRAKRTGDQAASAGEGTKSDFETAIRFAKTNEQREEVYQTQAEFLFNAKEMTKAAEIWAQTSQPLEEVSLRFLAIPEIPGLIHFLRQRLIQLRPEHRIQRIALATWIVELYLNCLSGIRTECNRPSQLHHAAMYAHKESELQSALSDFMRQNHEWLDRNTTIQLLASHGRTDLLVNYCDEAGEFERIVSLHVQEEKWSAAIQILDDIDPVIAAPLLYKYSPILVRHQPAEIGAVWRHCKDTVDANLLIPALVACIAPSSHSPATGPGHEEAEVMARSYLLWYLSRYEDGEFDVSPSPELYQMLLSMLVRMDDERTLLQFVRQQCTAAQEARRADRLAWERGSVSDDDGDSTERMSDKSRSRIDERAEAHRLDLDYALRLCAQTGNVRSQAELSFAMGMYETAIQLLLSPQVRDTETARQFVRELQEMASQDVYTPDTAKRRQTVAILQGLSPTEHRELVRRLWLIIASGVMESSNEVRRVIALMHEANSTSRGWNAAPAGGLAALDPLGSEEEEDFLTIEDILPLFSNDSIIDHFKRPIMDSLEKYNESITSLRHEMEDYTGTADQLKEIVEDLKNRVVSIDPRTKCSFCGSVLGDGPVYAFRTGMRYHRHCLVQSTARYLPADRQRELKLKVDELQRLEISRSRQGVGRAALTRMAELQREVDDLVGRRDVVMSEEIIESIDIALPDSTVACRDDGGRGTSEHDWDI